MVFQRKSSIFVRDMKRRINLFRYIIGIVLTLCCLPIDAVDKELGSAVTLKTKGDAYYEAGQYIKALEYYTDGLDQAKAEGDTHVYYACIGNIGNIYAMISDYRRALHYYNMGIEASKKSKNIEMQWNFATNMVAIYCLMNDTKKAKVFFSLQNSLPISNTTLRRYYFLSNQAFIAQTEKNYKLAEYYHKEAIGYAHDKGMATEYKTSQYIELGNVELKKNNPNQAISYYRQAMDSTQTEQSRSQLVNIYQQLSTAYSAAGNKDSATHYKNLYLAMSDSIFNVSQFNMAGSKLFEYENSENQRQIDHLTSQNSLQLIVIVVFVLLAVALAYLYIALRRKTRGLLDAQRLLVSKNEELMLSARQSKQLLTQYVSAKDSSKEYGEQTTKDTSTKDKSGDIALGEEQRNRLLDRILAVLDDISVISRSDFSLANLAEMVGSNTKYVSWVINDTYNKNFRTLLGEYRIREACKRLSDREHYANMTMQAIYEEVGFNSAASFIKAFKNVNGMTPSTYQRLVANNAEVVTPQA